MPVPCLGVTSVGSTRPAADVGPGRVSGLSPRGERAPLAFGWQNVPSDVDFRGVPSGHASSSSMCSNVRLATLSYQRMASWLCSSNPKPVPIVYLLNARVIIPDSPTGFTTQQKGGRQTRAHSKKQRWPHQHSRRVSAINLRELLLVTTCRSSLSIFAAQAAVFTRRPL